MGKGSRKARNVHLKSLSTQLPSPQGLKGALDDFHIKDKEETGKLGAHILEILTKFVTCFHLFLQINHFLLQWNRKGSKASSQAPLPLARSSGRPRRGTEVLT